MNTHQEAAGALLAAVQKADPQATFRFTANETNIRANAFFQRYDRALPAGLLGLAVLHSSGNLLSYAALSGTAADTLQLQLSNGAVHALQGDLSRSQLANILAGLTPTQDKALLEYVIFTPSGNEVLTAIERLDTDFYERYKAQTGLAELFVYEQGSSLSGKWFDPDHCNDCGGGGKRCASYSKKCIH